MTVTFLQRLEFVGREDDEVAFFKFIALDLVGALDHLLCLFRDVLLLQPRAFLARQIEAHRSAGLGCV